MKLYLPFLCFVMKYGRPGVISFIARRSLGLFWWWFRLFYRDWRYRGEAILEEPLEWLNILWCQEGPPKGLFCSWRRCLFDFKAPLLFFSLALSLLLGYIIDRPPYILPAVSKSPACFVYPQLRLEVRASCQDILFILHFFVPLFCALFYRLWRKKEHKHGLYLLSTRLLRATR